MEIYNALQIKNGKKVQKKGMNSFTQPIQFLSKDDKDEDWAMHNMDWLEWQGIKQISFNAKRLMKNYKLAKGVMDKSDYMSVIEDEGLDDLLNTIGAPITNDENSALELKFYPIIPNIINVLTTEFAKRNTRIDYRAVDEYSYNEIMEAKANEIGDLLLKDAEQKMAQKLMAQGVDLNSEEAQQQMAPDLLKRLPEIEEFYSKSYQTIGEQWAAKQHEIDVNRFSMDELEEIAFRDMLITDREFWHFRMKDDDYEVELWNPVLTFYHKSPNVRYISDSSWVGKIEMLTISDVIDMYGPILNEDQLSALENLHPARAGRYLLNGIGNDGSYYNPNVSHDTNLSSSLNMKKHMSFFENHYNVNDVVSWIVGESEQPASFRSYQMLRVTTGYWKTQRRVGYLTSIDEGGQTTVSIIDETFVPTNNPIYNNKFDKNKNAETLVFGDHIEWLWINQTYGGVKIGPNRMMFQDNREDGEFGPIYIGIDQNKIGPLRFQFKGDDNMYGCKLPVEGKVFTERNTKSSSLVDLMKPSQITYNMVNNQIADILIDELGSVVALDQNALPQHSLGDDWGKGNYAKAYVAMKDFQVLPFDTTLSNTEGNLGFSHLQVLNLEQTQRLMSRIQLANYFKNQALEVVGFTPQRLGQQVGQTNTATGVEQSVSASYAQTEVYFIQHSDYLMPRVHQMRTNLAQFYHSKKSSIRLQTSLSNDERKFFEINGTDLLLLDLNVFCKTNANMRSVLEQVKKTQSIDNDLDAEEWLADSFVDFARNNKKAETIPEKIKTMFVPH
jgi:hypothetical protein